MGVSYNSHSDFLLLIFCSYFLNGWCRKVIIASSRRCIDDHISLLGWMDESVKIDACKFELVDDRFTPRIELQGALVFHFGLLFFLHSLNFQVSLYWGT